MAPLKHRQVTCLAAASDEYPCLKGHGPIEACPILPALAQPVAYPCLKGHGPIEATLYLTGDMEWQPNIHA